MSLLFDKIDDLPYWAQEDILKYQDEIARLKEENKKLIGEIVELEKKYSKQPTK